MTRTADDQPILGKFTAQERALLLCDENSFKGEATDGLLIGRGEIHGQPIFVFASEPAAGGFNAEQAGKLIALYRQATDAKAPLIGFFDSAGYTLRGDLSWFQDYDALLHMQTEARGNCLRLAIIAGPCTGADAILATGMDVRFMIENTASLYMTGPAILQQFSDQPLDTAFGKAANAAEHGLVEAIYPDEIAAIAEARRLIAYTSHNWQSFDKPERDAIALEKLIPDDPTSVYDMREIIMRIADEGDVFELSQTHAENAVTCLVRLGGRTIGTIANQPCTLGGTLDVKALQKFERFAKFCAGRSWPLLSIIDVPGFLPQADQEKQNIAEHAAALAMMFAQGKGPQLSLVTGQAFGAAFSLMRSQNHCLAWPHARFGMLKAEDATYSALEAKAQGLVAEVIPPPDTRRHLIAALSTN